MERILDAALQVLDERGAHALSLRAVADRLSSSTATLYRHVSGRAELVELVVDRMVGEMDLSDEAYNDLEWDEACRRLSTSLFEALSRHGSVARLLVDTVPTGPNSMALRERMLSALMRAGFSPETSARAMTSLAHYCVGFAMQAAPEHADQQDTDQSAVFEAAAAELPLLASVADYLPRPLPDEFAFGLDMLLSGLGATAAAQNARV